MAARLPVLFCAHGNPMNAMRQNGFTRFLKAWRAHLPRPRALLAVSAHWESATLTLTAAPRPEVLYDFQGFPPQLYELRYPARGAPDVAQRVQELLGAAGFEAGMYWQQGLDHGVWAPLMHLYPEADIPIAQLSLLAGAPLARHLEVGRALAPLRSEGVLVLCSGNLVHNLSTADLSREGHTPEAWALAVDAWIKDQLDHWRVDGLARIHEAIPDGRKAHPSLEHYAPLLVGCGAAEPRPEVSYPYEGFEHGTISMRCVRFG
jgi:4,5-DOPA dioxygenase extradiol